MANKAVALFLFLVLVAAAESHWPQSDEPPATAAHGGKRRNAAAAAPTQLHFFFHDTVNGKSLTAVRVLDPPASSAASSLFFGMVNVMDDPLTEGPEQDSSPVGRAQGVGLWARRVHYPNKNDTADSARQRNP
ncbi:unnamed protein product [Urochloa humidicola]